MNILVITTSLHGNRSATRKMTAAFLQKFTGEHHRIIERDLALEPIPHLSAASAAAIRGDDAADDGLELSDTLIAELEAADILVLGVPMYNFTIPSTLKAWIDRVVRARRTFSYEGGTPRGLLNPAKQVLLFLSSDGIYTTGPAAPMDFVEPYLRAILGFVGLTDVTVVRAEAQAIPNLGARNLREATERATTLTN